MKRKKNNIVSTNQEMEMFIRKNTVFYSENWKIHSNKVFKGWNFAACFFSFEWMLYRKLYMEAFFLNLAIRSISKIPNIFLSSIRISIFNFSLVDIVISIIVGVIANTLYYNKYLRVLNSSIELSEEERYVILKKKGGVNYLILLIYFVYVALVLINRH